MRRAVATCWWCGEAFKYILVTKPRRTCGAECEHARSRQKENDRRRARKAAAKRLAPAH